MTVENKNLLKSLLITTLAASLVLALLNWLLYLITKNSYATGFFTYNPGILNIGSLLSVILIEVIIIVALMKLRVKNTLRQVIILSLPGICLTGVLYITGLAFSISFVPKGLYQPLDGAICTFIISAISLILGLIVGYCSFILDTKKKPYRSLVTCIVLAALAIGIFTFIDVKQTTNAVNNLYKAAKNQSKDVVTANNLDFTVYEPTYTVPGYSHTVGFEGPSVMTGFGNEAYSISFPYQDDNKVMNGGYYNYTVYDYKVMSSFSPPASCGPDNENDTIKNCQLIGTTSDGDKVYYVYDADLGDYQAYCLMGNNTLVNIDIDGLLAAHQSEKSRAQYNQILELYNSMGTLTSQQVLDYINYN
jgi:hypothetical protein